MKTPLSKPARSKASYSDEYKQEALELWRASGRSAAKVATELGIRPPLLYRWARTERAPEASKIVRKPARSLEQLEAEIHRSRAENAKLLEQREVLTRSRNTSRTCSINWGFDNRSGAIALAWQTQLPEMMLG